MKDNRIHTLAQNPLAGIFLLLAALFWLGTPDAARAASGSWADNDLSAARLISAVERTGDLETLPLALELQLKPGWKAYWRAPGDAGLPPYFDWDGSTNLDDAEVLWPLPERHTLLGFETFGYEGTVILPVDITPETPGKALDARLHLRLMICKDVCVPQNLAMSITLPEGPAATTVFANPIERWRARVPGNGREAGLEVTALGKTQLDDATPALLVSAKADPPFAKDIDVFVETASGMSFARPTAQVTQGGTHAQITVPLAGGLLDGESFDADVLRNKPVTLTLVTGRGDDARAMEYTGTPQDSVAPDTAAPDATAPEPGEKTGLLGLLITAFIGGIILNLMPCVLPVLSLKLLSAVSHHDAPPARVRAGFLAAAAGIVTSFLIIAVVLAAMKAAGAAVGWGIQFQHPAFLAMMAVIVSLFACNMWGFFEIPLPRFIAEHAGRSDDHGEHEPTMAGHFATGMLATALATPCTAPFVGTAVGFALAGGVGEILSIFTAMGAGLALPYLLVAAFPKLAHALPKPGRWMQHVKTVLGIALIGTAIWLLWVLAGQAGTMAAWISAAFIALATGVLSRRRAMPGGRSIVIALLLAAVGVPSLAQPQTGSVVSAADDIWITFNADEIPGHVRNGKTVFVDITADWCLTCKANKKFTLSQPAIQAALDNENIIAMQGDWTKPDETIRTFLAAHGRYGIPFNIVYGPGAPDGIILPELLSADDVLDAVEKAAQD